MAISDLLTKLTDDIRDSYDAVEEKGGTLPEHKNTDSLPDAIRSIEGGGGDIKYHTPYGRLWYVPFENTAEVEFAAECSVTINTKKFLAYISTNPIMSWGDDQRADFDYNSEEETWQSWSFENPVDGLTAEQMAEQLGITVTVNTGAEWAMFEIVVENTVIPGGDWVYRDLVQTDWDQWLASYEWSAGQTRHSVNGLSISNDYFRRFEFGTEVLTIPSFTNSEGLFSYTGIQEIAEIPANISGAMEIQNVNLSVLVAGGDITELYLPNCQLKGIIYNPNTPTGSIKPTLHVSGNTLNCPIFVGPNVYHLTIESSSTFSQPILLSGGKNVLIRDLDVFNQPIIFPEGVLAINFYNNRAFNQDVILPSTLTTQTSAPGIWTAFTNCDSMVKTINVGNLSPSVFVGTDGANAHPYLATNNSSANCYTQGIKIAGANRQAWLNAFPNLSGQSFPTHSGSRWYRKLVDAGY